jgi:hypothetical protein
LYIKDNISCFDTPWAGKLAFTTKHAFFCFGFYIEGFTPLDISDHFPQAERGKYSCTAGSRAGAARNADPERRLMFKQVSFDTPVIAVVIDLAVSAYGIAEVWHPGYWSLVIR